MAAHSPTAGGVFAGSTAAPPGQHVRYGDLYVAFLDDRIAQHTRRNADKER
jgi:hypothetical protein